MNKAITFYPKGKNESNYSFSTLDNTYVSYDEKEILVSPQPESSWHDLLEVVTKDYDFDIILIDKDCKVEDCLNIIFHFRLTPDWNKCLIPIFWLSRKDFIEVAKGFSTKQIIPDRLTTFINIRDFENNQEFCLHIEDMIETIIQKEEYQDSEKLVVYPFSGSHQITNEWGAYILAEVTGFTETVDQIKEEKGKELYFKFLRKSLPPSLTIESLQEPTITSQPILGLLVDDNHDKGWSNLLNETLKTLNSNSSLIVFDDSTFYEKENNDKWDELSAKIESTNINVIFLDLRLSEKEATEAHTHTDIEKFSGAVLLKKIKESYPYLSVIMFTASNKAWNMERLLDIGADGYFIKPSPETSENINVVCEEYLSLVKLIKSSKQKYGTLYPFWKYIKIIDEEETFIKERDHMEQMTQVHERIKERLYMFFGLLKRDFEDSSFNKERFHYSDKKLAFMTLWSCLNDMSVKQISGKRI